MDPFDRALIRAISEAHRMIAYRPSWRQVTGSITSAILLQQMIYRWEGNNCQPFYKYKEPCAADDYRPGDSWCEELGFSRSEFDSALKSIGQKISRNVEKDPNALVWYWTMQDRKTWYEVNFPALRKATFPLYVAQDSDDRKSDFPAIDLLYTKNTSENTSERENAPTAQPPAPQPAAPKMRSDEYEMPSQANSSLPPKQSKARSRSAKVDGRKFKDGYILPGKGENAVEIYYERYSIRNDNERLSAPVEDDLLRAVPDKDLPRWRLVVQAWQQAGYKATNIRGQLDWLRDGIPDLKPSGYTNDSNFGLAAYAEKERRRYEQDFGPDEEATPEQKQRIWAELQRIRGITPPDEYSSAGT